MKEDSKIGCLKGREGGGETPVWTEGEGQLSVVFDCTSSTSRQAENSAPSPRPP